MRRVAGDRLYAMWWLIALRGLRRREAAGLRWVDVDLEARVVMIGGQRLAYGQTIAVGPPKTGASRRTIARGDWPRVRRTGVSVNLRFATADVK